jgi:hypothetical protein
MKQSATPSKQMPLRNKKRHPLLLFLVICSVTFFASGADIFQRFVPRAVCMYYNQKLIFLHGVSDLVIFIAYAVDGVLLFRLHRVLSKRGFPFSQYAYWFAGFIFFCGITHLMGFLNLIVTFYWIDGIAKLLTAWFSGLVCLALYREYPNMKNIMTPKEIAELTERYEELLKRLEPKNEEPAP